MEDLISRQMAIDALDELHYNDREDWCFVLDTIEHLPSAQPEQHWIPCSERLPEDGETVLVQFDDGDMDILTFPSIYKRLNRVAWMPLPEPWEEQP